MVEGQHRLNLGSRSKKQVPVLKSEAPLPHFARLCMEMNALSLATGAKSAKSAHAIASYHLVLEKELSRGQIGF